MLAATLKRGLILWAVMAMVASLADYHKLVDVHRPLGILILIFDFHNVGEPALTSGLHVGCG